MKALTIVVLLACSVSINAADLPRADEAAIRETMRRYVNGWIAGDATAVMALLTKDAVLIPNEKPPYVGAGAIRTYWFPAAAPAAALTRFETTIDQVSGSSKMAVVRGTQVIEWTASGEKWRTRGNCLTVLRKLPS